MYDDGADDDKGIRHYILVLWMCNRGLFGEEEKKCVALTEPQCE